MATEHNEVKNISRRPKPVTGPDGSIVGTAGKKQLAAAIAYVTRSELEDPRSRIRYGYEGRGEDLIGWELMLPEGAPAELQNLQGLVDALEAAETRVDARTGKEGNFAIPREIPAKERIEFCRSFLYREMVAKGIPVIFALHSVIATDGQENLHCHWIAGTRTIDPQTGKFGGKKAGLLERPEDVTAFRLRFADHANQHLESAGAPDRISGKSFKKQAADHLAIAADLSKPSYERAAAAELANLLDRPAERRLSPALFSSRKQKMGIETLSDREKRRAPLADPGEIYDLLRLRVRRSRLRKEILDGLAAKRALAALKDLAARGRSAWIRAGGMFRRTRAVIEIDGRTIAVKESRPSLISPQTQEPPVISIESEVGGQTRKIRRPMSQEKIKQQQFAIEMRRRMAAQQPKPRLVSKNAPEFPKTTIKIVDRQETLTKGQSR